MLDSIKRTYRLRQLSRIETRIRSAYAKDIREARKSKKKPGDIALIEGNEQWEIESVQDEIEHLHTQALVKQASRYRVPLPEGGWERSLHLGGRYLTSEGYAALRRAIRAERQERWELRLQWMPPLVSLITSIAGLLGIITGVLAVLGK